MRYPTTTTFSPGSSTTIASVSSRTFAPPSYALWIAQAALAVLFIFAGVMKLVLPVEDITGDTGLPGAFLRFIGVMETLGGIGMVAPGLARIRPGLTPLAACGLAIIMVGATVVTLATGPVAGAFIPFVVGLAALFVAYGRRSWLVR